ncbi:hypothetical protein [Lichenicoccus sp.]|uniref:hypothetical protein n=1 Tax=Lichenicoccus sp. TaxID=2781899 RepID=UPI003D0DFC0F
MNSGYARRAHNTQISAYVLRGDNDIKQQFGIVAEVLLIVSNFPLLQPRTLQAVEQVMHEPPAGGRVDPTVFFLITPDDSALRWIKNRVLENSQSRIPVVFTTRQISTEANDRYFIRRQVSEQLFSRNLFNDQLPLVNDLTFVGRDGQVTEALTAIKQSQNRGLFGLRKTGKTSVLYKVKRLADRDGMVTLYYDCKDTEFRNLHWDQFLERIIKDLSATLPKKRSSDDGAQHVSGRFKSIVKSVAARAKICIIFDEIEWVSPLAKIDLHWHTEFINFWQTMWTTQSELRCIAFLIAGVNPTVVEADTFSEMQNPVFSIVPPQYITGLSQREVGTLINHIGKWMGLTFEEDAVEYIAARYGGHPLLTRMACSHLHTFIEQRGTRRPVRVSAKVLKLTEDDREADIALYSRHVVSELGSFYPMEYQMLETLAAGNVAEFFELSEGKDYTRHLRGYGLIDVSSRAKPIIKIPMIGRYINEVRSGREGEAPGPQLVHQGHRNVWLKDRLARITIDTRQVERVAHEKGLARLYGENGFPEAERFAALSVCITMADFEHFINVCNRCFVEPVENRGAAAGKRSYFWKDIQEAYPELFQALLRTKLYRHDKMHLMLKKNVEDQLRSFIEKDFMGLAPEQTSDPPFALQQMVVNGLFIALQAELERLT